MGNDQVGGLISFERTGIRDHIEGNSRRPRDRHDKFCCAGLVVTSRTPLVDFDQGAGQTR
jgi:hypothetical protein